MKKKIVAVTLLVALLSTAFPVSASAKFDWDGWEVTEREALTEYYAPFHDATLDEILCCTANILATYAQATDPSEAWIPSNIIFRFSPENALSLDEVRAATDDKVKSAISMLEKHIISSSSAQSALFGHMHASLFPVDYSVYLATYSGYTDPSLRSGEVRRKLTEIADAAKAYADTDQGRLAFINKYLIDHVTYLGRRSEYNWGNDTYSAVILGKAVCSGYTAAVQDLCFLLGIPSIILRGDEHVWNCVYVDGKWKMLDVTWNDNPGYETTYFLVDSIDDAMHDITIHDNLVNIEIAKKFALLLHHKIVQVVIDGRPVIFDAPPRMVSGRTMVPLRAIFEALGAEIEWNGDTQTVYAKVNGREIVLPVGSVSPTVNGAVVAIDQPALVENGRTLIPLRFVAEASGASVEWDGANNTAFIR